MAAPDAFLGFEGHVRDALAHLHVPGHLKSHPLTRFLRVDSPRASSLGRALRQALLDAIDSLGPNANLPASSHLSRAYQILRLRYVEALEVSQVLDWLSIGRSLSYLGLERAIEGVSAILWERGGLGEATAARPRTGPRGWAGSSRRPSRQGMGMRTDPGLRESRKREPTRLSPSCLGA